MPPRSTGRCAVCSAPILRGQKFALAGTEAIHRACLGNITEGTRMRIARHEAETMAQAANGHAQRLTQRIAHLDAEIVRYRAQAEAERKRAELAERALDELAKTRITATDKKKRLEALAPDERLVIRDAFMAGRELDALLMLIAALKQPDAN